ncbi:glycoside hydrolase family 18 protein [Paenibacillus cremeus]|uniref:glycoside hydrolase family 18 protein n=1 Tax=Paenibacillus cremeus TaxID=2163881 RepID=UPI001646EAE1|nr:glycosyl hydrolase family 18 protein [Paenibacillus cremeus]
MKRTVVFRHVLVVSMILSFFFAFFAPDAYAARDRRAPTAPTGLKVTSVTDRTAVLDWNAATDNVKVTSYWVYQGSALLTKTTGLTYTATGLTPGQKYTFSVKAADAAGNVSSSSSSVSATTLASTPAPTKKALIGYYSGWSTYNGKQVADLDGSQLTQINYAFAAIGPDLKIALGDSYADVEQRFPNDTGSEPFFGNLGQLVKLKQRYPQLKTLISVGGWSGSAHFSDVALTEASRTAFANSALAFILKYKMDGIDIDWEYPVAGGDPGNITRPEDKVNFTLLMKKLRETLDAQKAKDGKTYLLSFAAAAGSSYINNVELSKLQTYVDYVNVMSYDMHGTWDSETGFNAPLYKDPAVGSASDIGIHDVMQLFLKAGVPSGKLVMGVPFYGYKYDQVANVNHGLYQSFQGGKALTYAEIVSGYLNQGYTRYYNAASQAPYLYNGSSLISYDDPESVQAKAAYVKSQGLAGAMIWTLGQDTVNRDLQSALYRGLQ